MHTQKVTDPYDREGPSFLVVPPKQRSSISSIRCECHVKVVDKTAKRAKTKLVLASIIALAFMAGEVVGKSGIYLEGGEHRGFPTPEVDIENNI